MSIRPLRQDVHAVVLVPSQDEWVVLRNEYEDLRPGIALGREFLSRTFGRRRVVFVHTGEDAMEAAVSAQYAVDRWNPRVLASDGQHEAFDHVAMRNGLSLVQVKELELNGPPEAAADDEPAALVEPAETLVSAGDSANLQPTLPFEPSDGAEPEPLQSEEDSVST